MVARIHDATALKAFRESPELYRLRHCLHLVPQAREEAPEAGSAFHAALKRWFDTYDVDAALDALREAWAPSGIAEMLGLSAPSEKRPLALFERLMQGYAEAWPQEREGFEVVRNESYLEGEFRVQAGNGEQSSHRSESFGCKRVAGHGPSGTPAAGDSGVPTTESGSPVKADDIASPAPSFRWCGIVDRKVRYADASEYIKDTKTTSAWLNQDFFAALDLDVQLPGYVGLELVNGRRCDGYIVDAIHVNTRTQKVDASHFVRHGPINVPQWKLTRWARDVEWTLRQIDALIAERGVDSPWPMYANFKFGKLGPYRSLYDLPPELHANEFGNFAEREWKPSER